MYKKLILNFWTRWGMRYFSLLSHFQISILMIYSLRFVLSTQHNRFIEIHRYKTWTNTLGYILAEESDFFYSFFKLFIQIINFDLSNNHSLETIDFKFK